MDLELTRGLAVRSCRASGIATVMLVVCITSVVDAGTVHVSPCGDDSWVGQSDVCRGPHGPKRSVQAGIDAAGEGDTVLVADGLYRGRGNRDLRFDGRGIELRSENGPDACVIDGTGPADDRSAFVLDGGEGADTVIYGFTVRGFHLDPASAGGAAMRIVGGNPTVRNCVFEDNSAGEGGAVLVEGGSPTFSGCLFDGNVAEGDGGAMFVVNGSPRLSRCLFIGNRGSGADGLLVRYGDPLLVNSAFVLHGVSTATIDKPSTGVNVTGNPTVINCTFANNRGTGLAVSDGTATILNSILWGNGNGSRPSGISGSAIVRHSDIQGGHPGQGNIDVDPRFAASDLSDFRLRHDSPCVDAGETSVVPGWADRELTGGPRLVRGNTQVITAELGPVDMGAYEFVPVDGDENGLVDLYEIRYENCNECDIEFGTTDTGLEFQQRPIAPIGSGSLGVADIDGDGDTDVVSIGPYPPAAEIFWHENTDGEGTFGPPVMVANSDQADGPTSIVAADLDGDGDADLLVSAQQFVNHAIQWYENLDGQGTFGGTQVIDEAYAALSIRAADLDGDGDLDSLHGAASEIAWHENTDGGATFAPKRLLSSEVDSTQSIFAADLDGDGDLDVLSASASDNKLAWYENTNGEGEFGPQRIVSISADAASSVIAADLDGDGDPDLLAGSGQDDEVAWYPNLDGLGSFGPKRVVTDFADGVEEVFAADVDGDGDDDVLSASVDSNQVVWYENLDGAGDFGTGRVVGTIAEAQAVLVADLNGDGTSDILAGGEDDTVWYRNESGDCNANGVPDSSDVSAQTSEDCDADGVPDECQPDCNDNGVPDDCDLASGSSDDCNGNGIADDCELDCNDNGTPDLCDIASAASSNCNGNNTPDECEPDCNDNAVPDECDIASATSADCTSDGIPDECEPDCNGNAIADSCDIESGTSPDLPQNGVPDECEPDCDGDGDTDGFEILIGAETDCDGNGVPDSCDLDAGLLDDCNQNSVADLCELAVDFTEHTVAAGIEFPWPTRIADLDGDADNDVLVMAAGVEEIYWYENIDGLGTFGAAKLIPVVFDNNGGLDLYDLDGDGDEDVLSGSFYEGKIAWNENNDSLGGFGPERLVGFTPHFLYSIVAADLDGDGDGDIAAGGQNFNVGRIAWFENLDGAGNFGPEILISSSPGNKNAEILAGDLDGDGDLDLVSIADRLVWYENLDGLGNFSDFQVISQERGQSIELSDLDRDGDLDVVATDSTSDRLAWYENDGQAGFGPAVEVSFVYSTEDAFASDLDGDGDPDLVALAELNFFWFENADGAGAFSTGRTVGWLDNPYSIRAGDLDSDGVPDLLVARAGENLLSWYENLSEDCDGNGVPDACDPDCNGNAIADACDLRDSFSIDCNGNAVPDECDTACSETCDQDADGCLDDVDSDPASPFACGDSDADGCDDCASGLYDPARDGPDFDWDGICDSGDCRSDDGTTWSNPTAIGSLQLRKGGGTTTLEWEPPSDAGATSVWYETLQSSSPADFFGPADCLEPYGLDTWSQDASVPGVGAAAYYLIRVENGCPGDGTLGPDSTGTPRSALDCP